MAKGGPATLPFPGFWLDGLKLLAGNRWDSWQEHRLGHLQPLPGPGVYKSRTRELVMPPGYTIRIGVHPCAFALDSYGPCPRVGNEIGNLA